MLAIFFIGSCEEPVQVCVRNDLLVETLSVADCHKKEVVAVVAVDFETAKLLIIALLHFPWVDCSVVLEVQLEQDRLLVDSKGLAVDVHRVIAEDIPESVQEYFRENLRFDPSRPFSSWSLGSTLLLGFIDFMMNSMDFLRSV